MFGSQQGINQYQKVGLQTGVQAASPLKLIIMMYDGAIQAIGIAEKKMALKDYPEKSKQITKAIMIIEQGLAANLNSEKGGELANQLREIYTYIIDKLYLANFKNEPKLLQESISLLKNLRSGWEEISTAAQPKGVANA